VNRFVILYGGADILGTFGSPDYLVSHRCDDKIVVSITVVFIGYCHNGPDIPVSDSTGIGNRI
jgi:hypothetical protein